MYSFEDRLNGKTYSLRPENTAAVVRASVQHSLTYNEPRKLWYYGPMFRHERPQAGRYRQFFQFGVEMLGYDSPESEVELILICNAVWRSIGLDGNLVPRLNLNCIGTSEERSSYVQALRDFFQKHVGILDNENLKRLKRNPLRILDSKNDNLVKLKEEAPKITAFLGNASKTHFENLKSDSKQRFCGKDLLPIEMIETQSNLLIFLLTKPNSGEQNIPSKIKGGQVSPKLKRNGRLLQNPGRTVFLIWTIVIE